jgi:hypothetical protein
LKPIYRKNGALNWGKYFFENALEFRVKKMV